MPTAWQIIPSTHVTMIPIRILPFTCFTIKIAVISTPINANTAPTTTARSAVLNDWMETKVESLLVTILASCRPIKAMNNPIPTDTAAFKEAGIALKMASRTFVAERMMKITPSTNTANNATCQEYPILPHTV